MTEFWLLLAPTEPTECSVLSENLYVVGPRLYTTAGLSDRTPAWVLHIIEYTAPAPLLQYNRTVTPAPMAVEGHQERNRHTRYETMRRLIPR